ncbi:hypothetical protein CYLTODRAFT_476370, partial [Cylindrobasidium torrendii FP15055 ss-10]
MMPVPASVDVPGAAVPAAVSSSVEKASLALTPPPSPPPPPTYIPCTGDPTDDMFVAHNKHVNAELGLQLGSPPTWNTLYVYDPLIAPHQYVDASSTAFVTGRAFSEVPKSLSPILLERAIFGQGRKTFYCVTNGTRVGVVLDCAEAMSYVQRVSNSHCFKSGSQANALRYFNGELTAGRVHIRAPSTPRPHIVVSLGEHWIIAVLLIIGTVAAYSYIL